MKSPVVGGAFPSGGEVSVGPRFNLCRDLLGSTGFIESHQGAVAAPEDKVSLGSGNGSLAPAQNLAMKFHGRLDLPITDVGAVDQRDAVSTAEEVGVGDFSIFQVGHAEGGEASSISG